MSMTDNSNTQFATLALWVARRHGLPVQPAVARVESRFRNSQGADGGWGYMYRPGSLIREPSTASMTCAGLLGLGIGFGSSHEAAAQKGARADRVQADFAKDRQVRAGLLALSTTVGEPVSGRKGKQAIPRLGRAGKVYYFFWSLERVAVAFGLNTIGNKDWYGWGSEIIVANQQDDGGWRGEFASCGADTCFALLFLRRANLASDLTTNLNGMIKDEAILKAGGSGGAALQQIPPGLTIDEKATPGTQQANSATPGKPPDPKPIEKPQPQPKVPSTEADASRLGNELARAPAERQDALLEKLRDGKGVAFTEALAQSIPKLTGAGKTKARDALAERLARMKADTLRQWLRYEDAEIRRATALACAMKEDRSHVTDLIPLLEDPEVTVARAAHVALKSLTGQDFGPTANATAVERTQAVAAWKTWWDKQK